MAIEELLSLDGDRNVYVVFETRHCQSGTNSKVQTLHELLESDIHAEILHPAEGSRDIKNSTLLILYGSQAQDV